MNINSRIKEWNYKRKHKYDLITKDCHPIFNDFTMMDKIPVPKDYKKIKMKVKRRSIK